MRNARFFSIPSLFLSIFGGALLGACSSESSDSTTNSSDASTVDAAQIVSESEGGTTEAGSDGGSTTYVEPTCSLKDDTGGPGQYNDACVQRTWIKDYTGTYTSAACELTIATDGAVAATFTMKVNGGPQAGTYTIDWEGGTGAGNDSYYRFTTDTTFATTKTLNFNAGQAVGTADERNAALRVEGIDTGTVVYKGNYGQVIGGKNDEVDCGAMTKK